jgi:hypothetical protein
MKETEFIDELMRHIIEGTKIPKVQVERAIGPILGFFIESILDKYFENHPDYSGKFEMISPEFPLKKDNNQSTNIDFLMVNNSRKMLVLFELKTDLGSIDKEQMETYSNYKKLISKFSTSEIKDDLIQINKASKGTKYETIISSFNKAIPNPSEIKESIIVYLAPNTQSLVNEIHKPDFALSFNDLPELIDHKYAEFWQIIRNILVQLDNNSLKKQQKGLSGNEVMNLIVNNIRLFSQYSALNPVYFQIGILGGGNTPNYQVKFSNGQIKTFRFNGNPHHFPVFKNSNLSKAIYWKDID